MTRLLDNYQHFGECYSVDAQGERLTFADYLQRYHRPPEKLVSSEGTLVPLLGFFELLAAGAAAGDTAILGKNLTYAGCVWIKDAQGVITAARTAKMHFCFTFDFPSDVPVDGRRNICESGISWNAMSPTEQTAFTTCLKRCLQFENQAARLFLFHRQRNLLEGSLLELKEAETLSLQMQFCLRLQEMLYRSELQNQGFSIESAWQLDKQDLGGSYYTYFEQAYDQSEPFEQLFWLEKLSALHASQKDYLQAAHLLNSAIAIARRYEVDEQTQSSLYKKLEILEELYCKMHLQLPLQKDFKSNLRYWRYRLATHRQHIEKLMQAGKTTKEIQDEWAKLLKIFFYDLMADIQQQMRTPPPPHAILGLGSLGRQEMCLYSDIEFAILIEKDTPEIQTYFQLLTSFLAFRIINLGETAWPLIRPRRMGNQMSESKSLTPHGFSMDIGGLEPRGKEGIYRLIGTAEQLAQYLNPQWVTKNQGEEILINALHDYSFLTGNQSLADSFEACRQNVLKTNLQGTNVRHVQSLQLLKGHLTEFKPWLEEQRIGLRAFDVKKDLYRPIQLIIGALALYKGITSSNTGLRISELQRQGLLSQQSAQILQTTLNSILNFRLRAHLFYHGSKEIIYVGRFDQKATGLFVISSGESQTLLEIYRVLIPFCQAATRFCQGEHNIFQTRPLYNSSIGSGDQSDENALNYQKALAAYTQNAALVPDDLDALNNLQRMKIKFRDAASALKYNEERLSVLKRRKGARNKLEFAEVYDDIGLCMRDLNRFQEALEYHRKALQLRLETLMPQHLDIASSYQMIGAELSNLSQHDEALGYLEQALEIRLAQLGESHEDVADNYNSISIVLHRLRRTSESMAYLEKALAIRIKTLGKNHPDVGFIHEQLGITLLFLSRPHESLRHLEAALAIYKPIYGDKSPHVNTLHTALNAVASHLGEKQAALENEHKLLADWKVKEGEHGSNVSLCYSNIAMTLRNLQRYEEALVPMTKAIGINNSQFKPKPSWNALCYSNYAMILRDLKRYLEALKHIELARTLWLQAHDPLHLNVARGFHNRSLILYDLSRYEEALADVSQALTIRKHHFKEHHLDVANSLYYKGLILQKLGKTVESKECLGLAKSMRQAILGQRSTTTTNSTGMWVPT
ncbi:MAG: tetratricopeptide repeat protein [Parachlamydia sp.]|nr:tetratricopeptide repeat protein [Parachlamydia sp.]